MNRRDFLKGVLAAGAFAAVPPIAKQAAAAVATPAAPKGHVWLALHASNADGTIGKLLATSRPYDLALVSEVPGWVRFPFEEGIKLGPDERVKLSVVLADDEGPKLAQDIEVQPMAADDPFRGDRRLTCLDIQASSTGEVRQPTNAWEDHDTWRRRYGKDAHARSARRGVLGEPE